MAKRSKASIRKSQAAILKEAERLKKAGINVTTAIVRIGGARPVRVGELRNRKESNG